jgi:hypothetical protein
VFDFGRDKNEEEAAEEKLRLIQMIDSMRE